MKGGDTMRNNLYMFRHERRLSQQEMADVIGCSRATYAAIEAGKQDGRMKFWDGLKNGFGLTDAQKGVLMAVEVKEKIN
jgi:transcriptional regulator with XRE-family HTH domain